MPSRRLLALIALIAALACGLTAEDSAHAEDGPLTITLKGPAVCETDAEFTDLDIGAVPIAWTVNGGSPPYEVLINGELFTTNSGAVDVACGRLHGGHDRYRITSGLVTVQAAVTDAAGRSAAALHDLYGLRVIRGQDGGPSWLAGGETFRLHGLLLTLPDAWSPTLGQYLSDDCSVPAENCGDRFQLGGMWINRWTGTEYSRSFRDPSRGIYLVIRPGDDAEIPVRFQQPNEDYDQLVASIGEPPNGYADVPHGGPASGRMSLTLEMPAICNSGSDLDIPVAWIAKGGRAPYEVTIEGDRYLGQRGIAEIHCGAALGKPNDSGRRRIQATAIDADGDTASARADLYVIEPRGWWRTDLTPGATYNLGLLIGLITAPQAAKTTVHATERELCVDSAEPWPYESSNCEPGMILTVSIGNDAASITYGRFSGHEYNRTVADGAPSALIAAFEQLLASIDASPTLPDDFVNASGPLRLAVFAEPVACAPRGSLSFYWTTTGGSWWPLRIEVDGQSPNMVGSSRFEIFCDDPLGAREVQVQVMESGPDPQTITQVHTVNVIFSRPWLGSLQFVAGSGCIVDQPFNARWEPSYSNPGDAQFIAALGDAETIVGSYETFQLRCPAVAGRHLLTIRPLDAPASQLENTWSTVVHAANARPERAER